MHSYAEASSTRLCGQGRQSAETSSVTTINDAETGRDSAQSTVEEYALQSNAFRASIQKQASTSDERDFCRSTNGRGM